jgi:hypothetical protein
METGLKPSPKRPQRRSPRLVGPVLSVGFVLFAVSLASAAGLSANQSRLGDGGGPAAGALDISYGTAYTNGIGYTVSSVTVTGLDTASCAGKTVEVTLTDTGSASLASGSAPIPGSGTTLTVAVSPALPAKDVTNIDVAIG